MTFELKSIKNTFNPFNRIKKSYMIRSILKKKHQVCNKSQIKKIALKYYLCFW